MEWYFSALFFLLFFSYRTMASISFFTKFVWLFFIYKFWFQGNKIKYYYHRSEEDEMDKKMYKNFVAYALIIDTEHLNEIEVGFFPSIFFLVFSFGAQNVNNK